MTDDLYGRSSVAVTNALGNAKQQAMERNYKDFVIVDVDSHHTEGDSWKDIVRHMDDNPLKEWAGSPREGRRILPSQGLGNQRNSDRIIRAGEAIEDESLKQRFVDDRRHKDVVRTVWSMDQMGADYTVIFPGGLLGLGLTPIIEAEVTIAKGYNRWLTKELLPQEDRIKVLLYLPFNDPKASLQFVEEFHDAPGVVGFVVTSQRNHVHVHHNDYAPVYSAIQELGMPLGFHSLYNWSDQSLSQVDKFISAHALGFVLGNLFHMTNWIVNGMSERFPDLNLIWIESGLAWVPFLMQRLDNEYMMRTSEAPLLTKLPSEYMRGMFYSSQPMERHRNMRALQNTFEMIDAPNRLLYSSDYPHWDCDMPATVYDLPFLSEAEKRSILGGTACKLLGLDPSTKRVTDVAQSKVAVSVAT